MAEEQGWQQQSGGHRLCANNCGFFGNPTTLDLCSKCYKTFRSKEQQLSKAKIAVEKSFIESVDTSALSSSVSVSSVSSKLILTSEPVIAPADVAPAPRTNRCAECRKRVGLTGFTCRCGTLFCGTHRYPEMHGCTFDFKKMGKEAIAKANPVVKGEKLHKI